LSVGGRSSAPPTKAQLPPPSQLARTKALSLWRAHATPRPRSPPVRAAPKRAAPANRNSGRDGGAEERNKKKGGGASGSNNGVGW
jgi:hypothetical protein